MKTTTYRAITNGKENEMAANYLKRGNIFTAWLLNEFYIIKDKWQNCFETNIPTMDGNDALIYNQVMSTEKIEISIY